MSASAPRSRSWRSSCARPRRSSPRCRPRARKNAELIVTPEQEQEIEHFQTEKLRIRKDLRAVRAGLDADIKHLGTTLKVINILVVPLGFALLALLFAVWRRRQRRRAGARAGGAAMSARRVAWLLAAGVLVIAFAIWLSSQRHLERATQAGDLVLPGLEHSVNTVTQLSVRKGDGTAATISAAARRWSVGERGWPADVSKIRKLLLAISAR